jgi:hypothetical protein
VKIFALRLEQHIDIAYQHAEKLQISGLIESFINGFYAQGYPDSDKTGQPRNITCVAMPVGRIRE